jgi:outer membrane protein TolC
MSLDDPAPLFLAGSLDEETSVPGREELIAGLRQRADVKALAAERESAVQMRKFAGADLKPTVAFTGSLQYQQDGVSQFWNGDNRSFQAGVAIKMPLFSAPKGGLHNEPPQRHASSRRRTPSTPPWTPRVWN